VPVPHPALAQQVPSLPQTTDDEEDLPMGLLNERRAVSGREE